MGRRGHRSRQRLGRRVIQLAHVLLQRACVQPEGEQQVADVGQPHQQHRLHAAVARPVDQGVLGRAPLPAPPQQLKGGKSPRLLKQPRHQAPIQCVESQIARNDPARRAAQDELVGSLLQHQGKYQKHRRPQKKGPPAPASPAEKQPQSQGRAKGD